MFAPLSIKIVYYGNRNKSRKIYLSGLQCMNTIHLGMGMVSGGAYGKY